METKEFRTPIHPEGAFNFLASLINGNKEFIHPDDQKISYF